MIAPKIFLCHASEDKETVIDMHGQLQDVGFQPWLDKVDLLPGEEWQVEIPKIIRASDFVLVFMSNNSVSKRGYVQKEFKLCLDTLTEFPEGQVYLIPIKIDDCEIPQKFSHLHYVRLQDNGSFAKIEKTIRRYFLKAHGAAQPISVSSDFTTMVANSAFPTYDLDANYRFVRWNAIFDEVIGKPFNIAQGQHVSDFVMLCKNYEEIIYRSVAIFSTGNLPTYDKEIIVFPTARFGSIVFNKTAFRTDKGEWHVELLPIDGEGFSEALHVMCEIADRKVIT